MLRIDVLNQGTFGTIYLHLDSEHPNNTLDMKVPFMAFVILKMWLVILFLCILFTSEIHVMY